MRLIKDEDKGRIERAVSLLKAIDAERPRSLAGEAIGELEIVLSNMDKSCDEVPVVKAPYLDLTVTKKKEKNTDGTRNTEA